MPEFDQAYFHVNLSLLVWNGGQGLKGGPGMSAGATRSAEGLFPFWKIQQVTDRIWLVSVLFLLGSCVT